MQFSLRLLTLAAASLLSFAASAQVVRCTDIRTGAVTYTDGECKPSTRAQEVQSRQTPEEIAQERAQAAQALEGRQQRLQVEAAAQQLENERQAQRQREQAARAVAAPADRSQAYARSPECARSRRNFEFATSSAGSLRYDQDAQLQAAQRQMELDCLGPEGYANLEKNRPPPAPAPIVVYPPPQWNPYPHQHQYPQRPWPPGPPPAPPTPPVPPAPRPLGVQPQPSVAPAPSIAPKPSAAPQSALQSPASNRRCNGIGCDDRPARP